MKSPGTSPVSATATGCCAAPVHSDRVPCRGPLVLPHGFEPNYTLGFVKGLLAGGVKPVVVSSDIDHRRLVQCGAAAVNLRGRQETGRGPLAKALNLLRYYAALLRLLARHRGAVVHFTGIFRNELVLLEGIALNVLFRLLAGRYIYTAHNVLPHSKANSRFFRTIYRFVYRVPHTILVHTAKAGEDLVKDFGVPPERVRVISIGLNEEMPMTGLSRETSRGALGLNDSDRVILFFGKLDEYKGVDLLIRAIESVPDPRYRLLLVGSFASHQYRDKILAILAGSVVSSQVRLVESYVPNGEVEAYFKAADVLALPYRNIYQSGLVFLAMRFGLPIVATDVGSFREYVTSDIGLLASSPEPDQFGRALKAFFARQAAFDSDRIMKFSARFRWSEICKSLLPLYNS